MVNCSVVKYLRERNEQKLQGKIYFSFSPKAKKKVRNSDTNYQKGNLNFPHFFALLFISQKVREITSWQINRKLKSAGNSNYPNFDS